MAKSYNKSGRSHREGISLIELADMFPNEKMGGGMTKTFSAVVVLLVGVVTPVTAQGFFCDRNQWANAEQVAGADALIVSFPEIVATFWTDLSAGDMVLSDDDRQTLMNAGNKLTHTLFGVLIETAGIAAVLRGAEETRINTIMSRLRSQLVQMSGGVELDGPSTYSEFRRAAIRCVADYDGASRDEQEEAKGTGVG